MKPSVFLILTVVLLSAASPAPAQSVSSSAMAADGGVPLGHLLESVAKRTGKKIVADPRVGENLPVHLYGQDVAKVDYDELLSILNVYGFTGVEQGGNVQVVPTAEVRQRGIPTVSGNENLPLAQYVTAIIRVKSVSASQLVPILRPLVPQQGHLAAVGCQNTLIMVDTLANVRRLKALIEALDVGEPRPDKCVRTPASPGSPPADG